MKKIFFFAAALLAVVSCGSAEQMAKQAEQVYVSCNPTPLTVKGGKITADISVSYPAKYFNPKAIMEVTPVIVYTGNEESIEPLMYQGEKVKNNYKTVLSSGSTVKETLVFPYKEGMAKSYLELRAKCTLDGKKWINLPTKKVADGCNITETLAPMKGYYALKDHNYQDIIMMTPEGQILYRINSSEVRSSELKGNSIIAFREALKDAAKNERMTIQNVEVVAYASPDGPEAKNEKLSDARSKSAEKAYDKVAKGAVNGIATDVKSIGEDWDGFKDLVANSGMEDKDLILRVLGMYQDPQVREKEIKNMSSVYKDLANDVLPQLRRARFIANVQYQNYTEAELINLINEGSEVLDEAALLKAATLAPKYEDKVAIYNKAIDRFNSERAQFNLAVIALDQKDLDAAYANIKKCNQKDPDVLNLLGVLALREGNASKASVYLNASATDLAKKNLGLVALLNGDYQAATEACGKEGVDAAVANLLAGYPSVALMCVKDCDCARANYVRAICYARQGKSDEATAALNKATSADSDLKARAKTDIEFANLK